MDQTMAARTFMGDSLGFHILFVMLGIALPLFTLLVEYWGIKRKNSGLLRTARLWSYLSTILVITGVISGTVVALQMFFVWPGILQFGGKVIGLAFSLEGYAFLLEAVFLAYYISTWDKIKGIKHVLIGIPIPLGAALSGFLITSVNAWMNHPIGFDYVDGQVVNARPVEAIFGTTSLLETAHSLAVYYMTVALVIVAVFAVTYLRHKPTGAALKNTQFLMKRFACIALGLMFVIAFFGDLSAKYLATTEPTKFAGIELLDKTGPYAPYRVGGSINDNGVAEGGIVVENGLSVLATGTTDGIVQGLDQADRSIWPPLFVHTIFDLKMAIVPFLFLIPAAFLVLIYKDAKKAYSKVMMWALVAAAIGATLALEFGWMLTEIGRQPWAINGYLLTKDAFTSSTGIQQIAVVFPLVFILLLVLTLVALRKMTVRFNAKEVRS